MTSTIRLILLASQALLLTMTTFAQDPAGTRSLVYSSHTGDYEEIRIPALLCAADGSLLAFAEGRRQPGDHAQNDIILRRSTDRGQTWGDIIFVQADPAKVFINPCAVVLPAGKVLLMYQEFPVGFHAREIGENVKRLEPGLEGDRISRTLLQSSDDHGATWSAPRDITAQTKRPVPIISTASGPGIGIVLERGPNPGRIIMPTNEGWWEEHGRIFNVFACYSDDGGDTWAYGDVAPRSDGIQGDEVQVVELADATLLMNSRGSFGNHRLTAQSTDGGLTWSALTVDGGLPEPRCMATILRYSWPENDRSRILFANPASHEDRARGTVRVSYDEGQTWPVSKLVVEGDFAYSCLTRLQDGSVGLLYETDHYRRIEFQRFTIDWLESP
jgi:sialidase-1